MVRLKELVFRLYQDDVLAFNSTMVRLKGSGRQRELPVQIFQFHYGTIKSPSQGA